MNSGQCSALAVGLLLAGAPVTLAAGRAGRRVAAVTASAVTLLALAVGVAAIVVTGGAWRVPVLLPDLPGLEVADTLSGAGAAGVIGLTVLAVTLSVQVFAAWYLATDDRYPRFAATVSLFAGAMLLLVVSRDLVLTLVGWEAMGWCSYLLIGHWSRRESARRAALKAFLVTRFADIGFVLGVVVLVATFRTTSIDGIVRLATEAFARGACATFSGSGTGAASFALAALVVGVLGKSAQIPFQDWLTDAMEGPTPASALIHAATMVAAGTWVLAQFAPVLAYAAPAHWLLAVSVSATMVFAGFTAFLQTDLKRLLAWSTISQIAVMLAPLAALPSAGAQAGAAGSRVTAEASRAAYDASVAHLYSHAIFKALLFLTVGWLSVLAGGTSARALTSSGRRAPLAYAAWALGLLSLAGVPLTVGGFSKEQVIHAASATGIEGVTPGVRQGIVTGALLLTVALTAAYAARAFAVVTAPVNASTPAAGHRSGDGGHAASGDGGRGVLAGGHGAGGEGPAAYGTTKVVIALLALATLAGSAGLFVGPLHGGEFSLLVLGLTVGLLVIGGIIGWFLRPDDSLAPSSWLRLAGTGFGADRAYVALVARPVVALARAVAYLDREVVDLYVRAAAAGTEAASRAGSRAHARERVATNLVWVVLGVLALVGVAWWA
jgi:NADH-quinone oxidoreductase subunit L